jgi:hypothetical protein
MNLNEKKLSFLGVEIDPPRGSVVEN